MNEHSLLKLVVVITYKRGSMTQQELNAWGISAVGGYKKYLYFYGNLDDLQDRLARNWRPGATAQFYEYSCEKTKRKVAGERRGEWTG